MRWRKKKLWKFAISQTASGIRQTIYGLNGTEKKHYFYLPNTSTFIYNESV